jgi:hypothetical protein
MLALRPTLTETPGRARSILAGAIVAGLACGFGIHLLRVDLGPGKC